MATNDIYKLINFKTCSVCWAVQPLANFKCNILEDDGFDAECLTCAPLVFRAEYVKPFVETDPVPEPDATKFCNKCGFSKPLVCFNRDRGRIDGRSQNCKECRNRMRRELRARENMAAIMIMEKKKVKPILPKPAEQPKPKPQPKKPILPIHIIIRPLSFDVNIMSLYKGNK